MIFDKTQLFADDLAHNGTETEVDLGAAEQGRGEPLHIGIQGHSLTSAGNITVDFQTSATAGSGHASEMTGVFTVAEINAGVRMTVPGGGGIKRYALLNLTGTTGGTYTAGIVMDMQSNT
jgi:hypothetical protein